MRVHVFIKRILVMTFAIACFLIKPDLLLTGYAQAEDGEDLTLQQAVDIALRNSPLLQVTISGRQLADAQFQEAWAGRLPLLQFSETFTRGNNPVFVFGSLLEQGRFGPQNFQISSLNNPDPISNFRTAITLKGPLFDQLQTDTQVAQARIGQHQADLHDAMVKQQLHFEVIRAYYGVLVAHAKKGVAGEAVKMGESDMKRIRDRFEKGLVVQSDLLAAEVQLAEFRQQQIASEGEAIIADAALNTVLGLPINTSLKVTGKLLDKKFETGGQEELIRLALFHRPDYARAGLAVLSNKEGVRGARREFLPRLDLFATYGASGRDLSSGSSDYTIGTSLTFNLFDGGRSARLRKARAAESMASAEQEHLANQIRLDVVRAYQQYVSARERLVVAGQVIDQAAETHRIVQNRYREGLTTITEVLRAETALVRARMNLVAARYDHYVSYAQVLLSIGMMTDIQPFLS